MELLTASARAHGPFAVVALAGELDMTGVSTAERTIRSARSDHSPHLVLDLTGLTFMDSTGLRVLLQAQRQTTAQQGTLALAAPAPAVRRVIEVTGLDRHFTIYDTLDEALSASID
ncbi:STAS domain-containing protein [Actinomadura craniellae]|uniref:STAS domain-containing protein n=1 Tax=Actinomadura craniellae TaxID=2231787 RepID=UPI001314AADB|nr:STAS domain-containing protein [Actinomadura craniellae]